MLLRACVVNHARDGVLLKQHGRRERDAHGQCTAVLAEAATSARFGLRYGLNDRKTGSDLLRIPSHVGIAAQSSVGVALDLASHLEHHRLDDIRAGGCRDRIDRDPKFAVHDLYRLLEFGGKIT